MNLLRTYGSTRQGSRFDSLTIQLVWQKAHAVPGFDPNILRKDACGAWIRRDQYGDTTPFGNGWEIDHIFPVSLGGPDLLHNLQPLQWENNRHKGSSLEWSCAIISK